MLSVTVGGTYEMRILLQGSIAPDRVQVASYLRSLARLVELGDLDEELLAAVD